MPRPKTNKKVLVIRSIQKYLVEAYGLKIPRSMRRIERAAQLIQPKIYVSKEGRPLFLGNRENIEGANEPNETQLQGSLEDEANRLLMDDLKLSSIIANGCKASNKLEIAMGVVFLLLDMGYKKYTSFESRNYEKLYNRVIKGKPFDIPLNKLFLKSREKIKEYQMSKGVNLGLAFSLICEYMDKGLIRREDFSSMLEIFDTPLTKKGVAVKEAELKQIKKEVILLLEDFVK
jgi:hypothetical protein